MKTFFSRLGVPSAVQPRRHPAARLGNFGRRQACFTLLWVWTITLLFPAHLAAQPTNFSDPAGVASYVREMLYWPEAAPTNRAIAAFRYQHLLYTNAGRIIPANSNMANLYAAAERGRAATAESYVRTGLLANPNSTLLAELLLDIYYDRAAAEFVLAANLMAAADRLRMGPPSIPTGLVLDDEIAMHQQALTAYRTTLAGYFQLLNDGLGTGTTPPAGSQWFKQLVPARDLSPASYLSNNSVVSVTGDAAPLFHGYKDLALLYQGLRDYGRAATALARLQWIRNNSGDLAQAQTLITESQRFLFLQSGLLQALFPTLQPQDPNAVDATSGLAEAVAGVQASLVELQALGQSIRGNAHPLGFSADFLMLVQKFAGQSGDIFDSFDALELRLNPSDLSSPLRYAQDLLEDEQASFDDYHGAKDQLLLQLVNVTSSTQDRLFQIVGAYPGTPEYHQPTSNVGSELWQQVQSINVARLRIEKNQTQLNNLLRQIEIEMAKAGQLASIKVQYGNQQATLTSEIAQLKAQQAFSSAIAAAAASVDFWNPSSWFGVGLNGADAFIQSNREKSKGWLEASKERLAAQEQAAIIGVESQALVKTLLLSLNTLAVDSQEAAQLLQQEIGRLVALHREQADLEQILAENQEALATRYFADPIHHLRCQHQTLLAHQSFQEAQRWLYFMARALEYKWNTPFVNYFYLGRKWSTATLSRLRNAEELGQFYNALVSFDSLVQLPKDDYFDWFSVRDDFFGYKLTNDVGQLAYYPDPTNPTGPTNLTGIQAFRRRLQSLTNTLGDIKLEFSTVREIPGGTFFRGARFDNAGTVLSAGLFLDKIKWMKINLPGSHTLGRSTLAGQLTYGGTSFIRNFDVGQFVPDRPDRLADEFSSYSTRYWYFHAPSASWEFTAALQSPVTMQLSTDSRVPPTVQEIDIFKERSVATTGWVLAIPTRDLGVPVLKVDELNDVELYFYHYAVSRQLSAGAATAAMTKTLSTPTATRPFPYYLKYLTPE